MPTGGPYSQCFPSAICPAKWKSILSNRGQSHTWLEEDVEARAGLVGIHPAQMPCSQPSRGGAARLASESFRQTSPGPALLPTPLPPSHRDAWPSKLSAPSGLFMHTDVCICVFLDDCFLIMLCNNKSGLVTQVTSSDELVITETLVEPPGQESRKC